MCNAIVKLSAVLICCIFPSQSFAGDHLTNTVQALNIVTGGTGDGVDDIDGDYKTGLAEGINELRLAAGVISLPVAAPVLRTTLEASWDEDWFASTAVYDLDGDGAMEIIAARHSVLYVWNSTGEKLWSAKVGEEGSQTISHGGGRQYASPVVGDLDNDGKGEIAIAYSNEVAVYDDTGALHSNWPQEFPGSTNEIRSITAADLDGNGTKEILAVKTGSGPVTMVWNIDGTTRSGWPQIDNNCEACSDYGGYNQNIGAADLDNNGLPEVVSTYDLAGIGFNYGDGTPLEAHEMFSGTYVSNIPMFHDLDLAIQGWGADGNDRDEFTDSPPVFADLDGDQLLEIILYSDHERAGEYTNRGNCLWVLHGDMSRAAGFETPICSGEPLYTGYEDNIVQVCPAPALANLTGDTRPEIIAPSYDGKMRSYEPDGTLQWRYQFDSSGGSFIGASGAAAGDLNNDGVSEIIFSTYSPDEDVSHLIILDAQGTELHRLSLESRGSMSVPTLADIDGDNMLEIILSLKDTLGGGVGGVQIYDVSTAEINDLPWPTGRGNFLRDGQQSSP